MAGDVDLMLVVPGVESFEGLFARAFEIDVVGRRVRVAAIPDLVAMKRVANRAKDLDHIEELEEHEREFGLRGQDSARDRP